MSMQELFHIGIVENDASDAKKLEGLLCEYFQKKEEPYEAAVYSSAFDFLDDIGKYNLVFMDIEMPGINGMEASFKIRENGFSLPLIVFVTNMAQFAIDGYKVNALDFCLKPITYGDLFLALEKARKILNQYVSRTLTIKTKNEILALPYSEIVSITMINHDVHIHYQGKDGGGKEARYRGSMKGLEEEFKDSPIIRINSGTFINLDHFASFDAAEGICKLNNGEMFSVSRSNRRTFLSVLAKR